MFFNGPCVPNGDFDVKASHVLGARTGSLGTMSVPPTRGGGTPDPGEPGSRTNTASQTRAAYSASLPNGLLKRHDGREPCRPLRGPQANEKSVICELISIWSRVEGLLASEFLCSWQQSVAGKHCRVRD